MQQKHVFQSERILDNHYNIEKVTLVKFDWKVKGNSVLGGQQAVVGFG